LSTVLIIGTYRQTLTVIRSVARAGYRVILGIHGETGGCERSRYVDEVWQHPDTDGDRFLDELNSFLTGRPEIKMVFPVGETELRCFLEKKDGMPPDVQFLMSDPESICLCLDKPAMSAIVDELGIPQASYASVSSSAALFDASDSIGYPCIVKPVDSTVRILDKKAITFDTAAEIRDCLSSWPPENLSLIVQKLVSGRRHNIYFFSSKGRIDALAQVEILRTDSLDGNGLAVSGITVSPSPVLVAYCEKILQRLNYDGAGCVQFLVDDAGDEISFLELNPRLGANFAIVYRAGIDLPAMMINAACEVTDRESMPIQHCGEGVRYAWVTGDIIGLKNAIRDKKVGIRQAAVWLFAMLRSSMKASVHITWDWRDPIPFLVSSSKAFVAFPLHTIRSTPNVPQRTNKESR